jgi:hypothetical protein
MVTVFQPWGAMAKLPKGYEARWEFEGVKKPAEAGSFKGAKCFTWPLGLPWWRQVRQARPLQREQPMELWLGLWLQHLQLPPLVLCLQVLSGQLGQQARLFCFWQCQNRRPSQRRAKSQRSKRPKPRADCHLEGSTSLFSPKIVGRL